MPRLTFIFSILVVMVGPFAGWAGPVVETTETRTGSSGSSSELPQLAPAPTTLGIAYETNAPPLASLNNIRGSKPNLVDLDLYVRSFARVVFEPEYRQRYPWVIKWKRPILIRLKGETEPRHHELLERVVGDLSLITGLPFDIIQPSDQISDLYVDILILVEEMGWICGLTDPIINVEGVLLHIRMGVTANLDGDNLTECFYEDISQALGMSGDNALTAESMYRSHDENGQWPRPTWHDVIILRTLYDRRIKPGMHEDQAMPIARLIIAELLEELNATAE